MKDYYRILEVSPSASFEVIKASYRALAKKYHPDTQTSSNMGKTMADINEAYETLSNSQSRKEYDQQYSRFIKDYTQTCERRNREIENAYIRAQRLPDDRLIYCFRTSGGAEKIGYARELEHRDYLYLDSNGVYQATYKYKNFRY